MHIAKLAVVSLNERRLACKAHIFAQILTVQFSVICFYDLLYSDNFKRATLIRIKKKTC